MQNIHKKRQIALCGALALLAATPSPFANAADSNIELPNAGQLLQQIERDAIIRPLPVQPKIEESTLEPEDQGHKVVVNQFKFEGNSAVTFNSSVDSMLAGYKGLIISSGSGGVSFVAAVGKINANTALGYLNIIGVNNNPTN